MAEYGWTAADFAKPAVKNSYNGLLNPLAQHRRPLTIEDGGAVARDRRSADAADVLVDLRRRGRGRRLLGRHGRALFQQDQDHHRRLRAAILLLGQDSAMRELTQEKSVWVNVR